MLCHRPITMALTLCWTLCLSGLLMVVSPTHGEIMRVEAEENSAVELTCPSDSDDKTKAWFRGLHDSNNPPSAVAIYSYTRASGAFYMAGATSETSLNRDTFTLTLSPVRLSHDDYFTCKVLTSSIRTEYFQRQLRVYIQPRIEMTGLNEIIRENDTVTVSCTIERISPALRDGAFTLTWGGDSPIRAVKTSNADQSFRYSVQVQRQVTRDDHDKVVTCAVDPTRGTRAETTRTVSVLYIITDTKPTISVAPPNPYENDDVTFTCNAEHVVANPRVFNVIWFKNGDVLQSWAMPGLTHGLKVTLSDAGNYSCRVGNEAGSTGMSALREIKVNCTVTNSGIDIRITWALVGAGGASLIFIVIIIIHVILLRRKKRNTTGTSAGDNGKHLPPVSTTDEGLTKNKVNVTPAKDQAKETEHSYQSLEPTYEDIDGNTRSNQAYANIP